MVKSDTFSLKEHGQHYDFSSLTPVQGRPRIPHQIPIQCLWFIGVQSESRGGINNVSPAAYKVAKRISQRS